MFIILYMTLKKITLIGLLLFFSVIPLFYANADLVNCGRTGQPSCTICDLVEGIHGIVQFIVSLIAIVGIAIITVAGIMYIVSSGSPSITSMAKTAVKNTLIGVAVILSAFVFLTFMLNSLFDNSNADLTVAEAGLSGVGGNAWNFTCSITPSASPTDANVGTGENVPPGETTPPGPTSGISAQEQAARDRLYAASNNQITVWESAPGKTAIDGLRPASFDGVVAFQREAGVPVLVTGAAENGPHAAGAKSHANGYKVDVQATTAVNNYIQNNYTSVPVSSTGRTDISAAYSDGRGNMYYKEGSHWDICYGCA